MEDKKKTGQEQSSKTAVQRINRNFFIVLGILLLLQLGIVLYCAVTDLREERKAVSETESLTVRVVGLDELQEQRQEVEAAELETQEQAAEESQMQEEQFLSLIFDEKENSVGKGQLKISGLSAATKTQLSFREADFITELTDFLQEQKIEASEIVFEKEIMTSAENVSGYKLQILGNEKLQLVAFFFPKLSGQYLFTMLENGEQKVQEHTEQQNVVVETPAPVQSQTEATVNENTYDASMLSITGIPEKLLNYLDNRYELQYSLYDYLYKNGYRDVKSVAVESYKIDAEEKKAEIQLIVPKTASITGIYNKENNVYLFY